MHCALVLKGGHHEWVSTSTAAPCSHRTLRDRTSNLQPFTKQPVDYNKQKLSNTNTGNCQSLLLFITEFRMCTHAGPHNQTHGHIPILPNILGKEKLFSKPLLYSWNSRWHDGNPFLCRKGLPKHMSFSLCHYRDLEKTPANEQKWFIQSV